ncbi:LysR family transcriptional regulator [Micromonospora sp. M12]
MERQVGAPLFARTSRVVRLTPIGRQFADELAPLVAGMDEAFQRAVDAGRGVTGTLRVAFLGEWTAPVLLQAVALFGERHPDCRVEVHEAQLSNTRSGLLDGSTDVLIASYPFDGMATGPALLSEGRALAVAAGHPLTRDVSVSQEVLADHPVVQYPAITSMEFKRDRTPDRTRPAGRCRRARPGTPSPRCCPWWRWAGASCRWGTRGATTRAPTCPTCPSTTRHPSSGASLAAQQHHQSGTRVRPRRD